MDKVTECIEPTFTCVLFILSVDTSIVVGVGHTFPYPDDEEALSSVRGSKRRSWNDESPDAVTPLLQSHSDGIEGEIDCSTDVLSKYKTGSNFRNNSEHFKP
nr:hypothetical protein [Synergistes jonesii]